MMAAGTPAADAVRAVTDADEGRDHRQLGMVNAQGRAATYTGAGCIDWAGSRREGGATAQGNILTGASVVDALMDTFLAGGAAFPELMFKALKAADGAGGDKRGRESAALLIVRHNGGYGNNDRWIDLRVDDHPAPVDEIARLLELNHLYLDRPAGRRPRADRRDARNQAPEPAGQGRLHAHDDPRRRIGGRGRGTGPRAHGRAARAAIQLGRPVVERDDGVDVSREPRGTRHGRGLD